jgi:(p)ppGpp synthase/HD superfamily hydrolase
VKDLLKKDGKAHFILGIKKGDLLMSDNIKNLIKLAKDIATEAHKGQFRYDGKTPFIEHPKYVANSFAEDNYKEKVVAWLHDVIEDTNITIPQLLEKGIPLELVIEVDVISKIEDEPYLEYLLRVKDNEIALRVKLADLDHNIMTSPGKHQRDKYTLAQYILKMKPLELGIRKGRGE